MKRPIDIERENKARAVGRKHEEITMRWLESENRTPKLWESLMKEYHDFEETIYPPPHIRFPQMPERVIKEGVHTFCSRCHSTTSRKFLGLFGKLICHNPKCDTHE